MHMTSCRYLHFSQVTCLSYMIRLSNGNIFRVIGPLFGEFTGHRWIPRTKAMYELLNLRALKILMSKIYIFQCMCMIFCVEFQKEHLEFHTK